MKNFQKSSGCRLLYLVLMAAVLFTGFVPSVSASDMEDSAVSALEPVRVGFFSNGDFMHKEDDGSYAGYDIEYYDTIAGYADWDVEIVDFDSLADAVSALERGDIDVLSGLSVTPERESKFLISSQKMCTAQIAVQVRADDDRYSAGDVTTMEGLTCGILKGSNVVKLYDDWCAENGLTPHVAEYDSLEARNQALFSGEVDAIAGGSAIEGAQKIAVFPSLDLYFMFNSNRSDLKSQLDRAMGIITLQDSTYAQSLFEKYFPVSRNTTPSFSADDKAFLADNPVIKVAVLKNDPPFSSAGRDGSVGGILPEYYEHLSKMIGVTFDCIPYASADDAYAAMEAGDVQVVGKAENDVFAATARGAILSNAYLDTNMVLLTRAGTDNVTSAAVPECNKAFVEKAVEALDSALKIESYPGSELCLSALRAGKVDAVICTQPAASWLLNRNRASEYVISAFGSRTWQIACAMPHTADGNHLRTILNKAIAVDYGYIEHLIATDTLEDSANLVSLVNRLPVRNIITLAAAVIALLLLCIAALIVLARHRNAERKLAVRQTELSVEQEANKAKNAFFGTVSHDMRTPLNGIMGFASLALKSDDVSEIKTYLEKIRTSGAILSNLVNDTLLISRLGSDSGALVPAPTQLQAVFSDVLEPTREIADQKGVTLRAEISGADSGYVLADVLHLQKLLLNLLSNAVKFTPAGGEVTFHAACTERGQVITISDTGVGMSDEFQPHAFEPFAQEDQEARSQGSGMGLSIVKSLVERMGGTIELKSKKGVGTTFTIRLNLPACPPPEPDTLVPANAKRLRGRHVLVCEDNALNMEIMKNMLEHAEMTVTARENGALGVTAFRESAEGTFDFVLLDLRMPVMDGYEAARAIRSLPRDDAKTVPIFAVSADAYPENEAAAREAGMNGHLSKPIDPDRLLDALAGALNSDA